MFHGADGNKDIPAVFSASIDELLPAGVTDLIGRERRLPRGTFMFVRGCKGLELGVVMIETYGAPT